MPALNQGNQLWSRGCSRKKRPMDEKAASFESRFLTKSAVKSSWQIQALSANRNRPSARAIRERRFTEAGAVPAARIARFHPTEIEPAARGRRVRDSRYRRDRDKST